jgi:cell division protein FtsI (penicillin-binding protein 3)
MLGRTDRRLRLIALLGAFVLVAGALGARLGYWTVVRASDLSARAAAQLEHTQTTPAQRGAIYDRSGTILLATTSYRNLLEASPAQLTADQGTAVATRLDAILGLHGDAASHLRDQLTHGADYAVLARELTDGQSEAVREGLADGSLQELALEPQAIRVYPDAGGAPGTTLASQLLGFVNASGNGQYGLEQRYQAALAGRPRVSRGLVDIAGRPLIDAQQVVDPGQPGANLRLTLDAGLQLQLEKELFAAMSADRATAATAVVIDADTGAVRAWASVPGYDANDYAAMASTDPGRFVDPIASQVYEPGSVMKMFVAAAGYDSGKLAPGTRFNDSGTLKVGDYVVADADHLPMGWLRFEDGIAYSRNVVASRAAFTLGSSVAAASRDLFDTWRQFGIGQPTGVDVAGEVPGIADDPSIDRWAPIDLANRSFGQAVAVTPIQLATSFAEMANGGHAIEPHVVAAVDGQPVELAAPRQVISAKLSSELQALMVHVVTSVPYYAADTLIPHYLVGGKTGTAQIWDPKAGDWLPNTFNLSFVGFVGRDTPQEIVALRLSRVTPKVVSQGVLDYPVSHYALFRRIAIDVIDALDIPPAASASEATSSSTSRP